MATFDLSPPSGTRDFLPDAVMTRERVIGIIKRTFESFGFLPLDTPAFERIDVLTGKYGQEGEKLIFKILKRGEQAATGEADLALRYDFTVPLARVVAQYRNKLGTIFKRYQIGPVWRADRPAKGRFREFYQCDVDVVGTRSPVVEAEVMLALAEALRALGLGGFTIKLNSRKVLRGLMEAYDVVSADAQRAALIALDKMDKLELAAVVEEMVQGGVPAQSASHLSDDIASPARIERVRTRLQNSAVGREGLEEVDRLEKLVTPVLRAGAIVFDPFLARGLDYYTGPVFEITAPGISSSIASGGRYDDLIGMFSREPIPACGGSLGLERILLLLDAAAKERPAAAPAAMVTVWDDASRVDALAMALALRDAGVSAEVFPGEGDLGKQLRYAAKKGISVCLLCGPDERAQGLVTVKNMTSTEQRKVPRADLASAVAQEIAKLPPDRG
jgi:histidyl-tRNA synthetase